MHQQLQENEFFSRQLFEANPWPMWVYDLETLRFLAVNNAAISHYGYSREEFLAMTIKDIRPPEDIPALLDNVTNITLGSERAGIWRHRLRDGRIIFVEVSSHTLSFEGLPAEIVLAHDVTERVEAEEKLRQNELLLKIAGQTARLGGWSIDLHDNSMRWSDEVCAIHEVPPGTSPSPEEGINYYAPEYRDRIKEVFDACVRDGKPYDEELQIITARGRRVWVRTIGHAVRDSSGKIIKVQGSFQDITETKRAWQEVNRLAERLMTILESITDAFFTVDRDWHFTYLNQEAERLLQCQRDDLLGKVIWAEFPEAIHSTFYSEYHRAIADNCTVEFEEYFGPLDLWVEVNAYPSEEGLAVYFRDITERKAAQEAMRESEERFRIISKATADAVWDWDMKTDSMWWNDGIRTLFGYSPDEIEPDITSWTNRLHPDEKDRIMKEVDRALKSGAESWSAEYRFRRKDGSYAYVWDRSFILRDESGKAVRMLGGKNDITESKLQQAKLAQQAELLDKAHDAIIIRSIDNRILFWNKGAERLYGWTADEVLGRAVEEFLYDDPRPFSEATDRLLHVGEWHGELEPKHKDGTPLITEARWTLVRDDSGTPSSILAINTDITQRKAAEEEIQHLAFYDALTGLPNRQLLLDRLQRATTASSRNGQHGALLFIDLDNFKILNDTLGHDIGDLLLQQVAQRLGTCIRESDSLARLGGDEFVVMLEDLSTDPLEAASQAETIGEKILTMLNEPYTLADYEHHSTPSIGVTLLSGLEHNVDELLKRADLAMYQAKGGGRNTIRFFDPEMQAAVANRSILEADLRKGLKQGDFLLYYQPQVNSDGQLLGAEALLRWQHPSRGIVSPAEFIPLAEDTGLILPIGQWVLETACEQLVSWAEQPETARLSLSVNISARQFHHQDFVEQVMTALDRAGANPRHLVLELTESLLVKDMDSTIAKMTALKAEGVGFSLDDFGTGYSSLTYLKRLPLDLLKIDQSFVRDVLTDPNDAAIVRTIVSLGQSLGLSVIAEGVETEAEQAFLASVDCHAYQGYLFSRPLPIEAFARYMCDNSLSPI